MSRGAFSSDMVYSMNDLSELKAYAFDRGVEIILGMLIIFCIYIYTKFDNTYFYPFTHNIHRY